MDNINLEGLKGAIDPIIQFFTGIWLLIEPLVVEVAKIAVVLVIGWLNLAISTLQDLLQRII